jgi:hypothetical protein
MSSAKSNATATATATAIATAAPIFYKPPTPAPLPADYEEFLASLNETERELMEMAQRKGKDGGLDSSFFVQWCRRYQSWLKAKAKAAATTV